MDPKLVQNGAAALLLDQASHRRGGAGLTGTGLTQEYLHDWDDKKCRFQHILIISIGS